MPATTRGTQIDSEDESDEDVYGTVEHSRSTAASGRWGLGTGLSFAGGVLVPMPSSPIPSFSSSSEPSASPASLSPADKMSGGPLRRRRRMISDLGMGGIWECPLYLCHKRYKKTSLQSIALHKAKCGSRPQLQQLMSQREEQIHKDRLLQQQSRQLREQQVMLNRQQEEQERQMMALETARHTLLVMQQQQHMEQHHQQIMQRPPSAAGSFLTHFSFGLIPPATAPFGTMSPPNQQLGAVSSSALHHMPPQHFSLTQTLSIPQPAAPPYPTTGQPSSSLVSTVSPVKQPDPARPLQSPSLLPFNLPVAPRPPSALNGSKVKKLLYQPQFTPESFARPSQLPSQLPQPASSQQVQSSSSWPLTLSMGGAGSLSNLSLPSVTSTSTTASCGQPLSVGSFGSLMPVPPPTQLTNQLQGQEMQQQSTTLQSPPAVTIHQLLMSPAFQLPLSHHGQQHQQQLAGSQCLLGSMPTHFVNTQATSIFVSSPSLSSKAACLPVGDSSSHPPSQSLSVDRPVTVPIVLSAMSPLSSLSSLQPPAAASALCSCLRSATLLHSTASSLL